MENWNYSRQPYPYNIAPQHKDKLKLIEKENDMELSHYTHSCNLKKEYNVYNAQEYSY